MQTYPVSFLMIFGLAMFHYVLPIPLTLIEFKPVTYNLEVPFETFFHHFLFVTVIVLTHRVYTKISDGKNIFRRILKKTDFYCTPSIRLIWISGIIGLFSSFYLYFVRGIWQQDVTDRNLIYYIATFFTGFVWMPLIILFSKFRNENYSIKSKIVPILIYSIFVFIMAIASNWRTIIFTGIILVISLLFAGVLSNYYRIREIISTKKVAIITIVIFIGLGPLIDLSYAMVIARHDRTKLSAIDFLDKTISIYNDKRTIEEAKKLASVVSDNGNFTIKNWDEKYLNNIVMNRFVNLKISDNCLYYAKRIGYQNPIMQNELKNQIVAMLPNALLGIFNIDYSKKIETASYSIGDFLYSQAIKDNQVKGSAVISSMPGVGMAIWGYWYLLLLFPIFLLIFAMFDSFVNEKNGRIVYSYLFFIMLVSTINYFNDRHVYTYEFRFIIRTYFESVIIFLIQMKIFRFIEQIGKGKIKSGNVNKYAS